MKKFIALLMISTLSACSVDYKESLTGEWKEVNCDFNHQNNFCSFTLTKSDHEGFDYTMTMMAKYGIAGGADKLTHQLAYLKDTNKLKGPTFTKLKVIDNDRIQYGNGRIFVRQ